MPAGGDWMENAFFHGGCRNRTVGWGFSKQAHRRKGRGERVDRHWCWGPSHPFPLPLGGGRAGSVLVEAAEVELELVGTVVLRLEAHVAWEQLHRLMILQEGGRHNGDGERGTAADRKCLMRKWEGEKAAIFIRELTSSSRAAPRRVSSRSTMMW
ncbi:hypothetical protein SEVIR_9G218855v4 [Setaria viridis]